MFTYPTVDGPNVSSPAAKGLKVSNPIAKGSNVSTASGVNKVGGQVIKVGGKKWACQYEEITCTWVCHIPNPKIVEMKHGQ